MLQWSDSENPAVADISAWVDERLPRLDEAIRHFELAWMAIPDDRAEALAGDERVAADRHYLRSVRRFTPFMLSPGEERALSAREAGAGTAWKSLRDRALGSLATRFDDGTGEREWTLSELEAARRSNPDREVRRQATAATRELVRPALPVLAQCYDAVVADRLSVDRLRGHDDPMAARNLENEIDARVVEELLAAAEAHLGTGRRWFATKARLLGLERLDSIDLSAAAIEAPPLPWDQGRRLTVEVFDSLSTVLGAEADRFFTEQRVDAEMRRGKPYGAFCIWPSTRVPGFALVNWSGQLSDLVALAHELGHGTHYALAAGAQTDNSFEPGLAVAEIPSTFAELWLVDHLLEVDPELGRAALSRELDQMVLVALYGTALARYEQAAYAARAGGTGAHSGTTRRALRGRAREGRGGCRLRRAGPAPDDLGVDAALRPRALLHLRVRLRPPGRRRPRAPRARAGVRGSLRAVPRPRRLRLPGRVAGHPRRRPRRAGHLERRLRDDRSLDRRSRAMTAVTSRT